MIRTLRCECGEHVTPEDVRAMRVFKWALLWKCPECGRGMRDLEVAHAPESPAPSPAAA